MDMEQGSPGDSDYESAQEVATGAANGSLPFKIRKQPSVPGAGGLRQPLKKKQPQQPLTTSIDLKIQKTIKNFFEADQS